MHLLIPLMYVEFHQDTHITWKVFFSQWSFLSVKLMVTIRIFKERMDIRWCLLNLTPRIFPWLWIWALISAQIITILYQEGTTQAFKVFRSDEQGHCSLLHHPLSSDESHHSGVGVYDPHPWEKDNQKGDGAMPEIGCLRFCCRSILILLEINLFFHLSKKGGPSHPYDNSSGLPRTGENAYRSRVSGMHWIKQEGPAIRSSWAWVFRDILRLWWELTVLLQLCLEIQSRDSLLSFSRRRKFGERRLKCWQVRLSPDDCSLPNDQQDPRTFHQRRAGDTASYPLA